MPVTALDPRTALVAIDLQKGLSTFPLLRPFGHVVANTALLASAFRAAKLPVIFVHIGFSADRGDMLRTRVESQMRLPAELPAEFFDLVPELEAQATDILVPKRQPNAFYGTDLDLQLRRRKVTGILLTGVLASVGVDYTARAAQERGYNVTFASDAIADVDPLANEFAFTKSFPRLGETGTTEEIVARLGA